MPTRVLLLTGFRGTGKRTLLRHLSAAQPPGERWAMLASAGDADALTPSLRISPLSGGCICCTGALSFRTSLVDVLRRQRPDRLLIRASSTADTHALLTVLAEGGIRSAIALDPVVALVSPEHWSSERHRRHSLWRAQLQSAALLVVNASGSEEQQARCTRELAASLGDGQRMEQLADLLDRPAEALACWPPQSTAQAARKIAR